MRGALDRYRDRNVVLFVAISLLSGFGGTAMALVAGVWTRELTGSNSLAALVGFCLYLPTALGPLLGTVVDRLPRRALLIGTNLSTAAALLILLAVTARRWWLILVVMLAYGASHVVRAAGESALLPAVLPAEVLGDVNGARTSAAEGMKLIAPLVGAGLFAWGGGPPVTILTAVVLTTAAGLYGLVRPDPRLRPHEAFPAHDEPDGSRPPTVWWARLGDGFRFLRTDPVLRRAVPIGAVAIAMSGLTTAAMYAVVTDGLHRPAAFLGVLTSAQGAGSILGGLVAGRLLARFGAVRVGVIGALLVAVAFAAFCVPWLPVAVGAALTTGLGLPWTLVAAMTAVQLRTPQRLLGRVAATAGSVLFTPLVVAIPVGAGLVLVDRRLPLLVAAAGCAFAGLLPLLRATTGRPSVEAGGGHPLS